MIKSDGELYVGQSYNVEETKAYWLIERGLAVEENKPAGPMEAKPAGPTEIKAKKKRNRGRTERES